MNFSIRHLQENGLSLVSLKEDRSGTEVVLLPAYGAALHAFSIRLQDGPFNVIDNYRDLAEIKKEIGRSFKSSKLSPFPCRIAGAKYNFEGKEYIFSNFFDDGTAIHGLLYDKAFTIADESAGESSASLTLAYLYNKEDAAYPYEYSCLVKYVLQPGNLLEVQTTVSNLDKRTLPIADGWHPYFQLGGKIDDWLLQFNAATILEFNGQLIPTGRLLKYDAFNEPRLIGNTRLDNCFVLEPGNRGPACGLFNPANGLKISFFPGAGYPYLQLYTPPGRQSIAVENLSAAPDSFNNKMGLLLLPPGHSQTFTVNYKVGVE